MAVRRSSIAWVVLAVIAIILVAAWIDGGEEPLRTITQPVELPEGTL